MTRKEQASQAQIPPPTKVYSDMMNKIRIKDLTNHLETIAPLPLQEAYDNAGLICGHPDTEVRGVLCSLDATEEIVEEAIRQNCNVVVAHHPIIFKGLKQINGKNYVERCIIKAIKNDIAIYAIHTNLDNVLHHGVNERIAYQLELNNLDMLIPKTPYATHMESALITGTGIVGSLSKAMSEPEFLQYLKEKMAAPCIRHTNLLNKTIQKVAICGGSGSSFLPAAIKQSCDVYVSADFKYHEFFDADGQILIADIGHYESEQYTIELLYEIITKNFSNFAVRKTNLNTNPVKYF